MKLEKLTIELRQSYLDAGPDNPYQAKLDVSYNDNRMTVQIGDQTCRKILELAGDEIADAAQVQIREFVQTALTVSKTPMIEGSDYEN